MAEENANAAAQAAPKADMSATALEIAKTAGFGSDEAKFKEFEREFVRKFYEKLGLSDIPVEFLNFDRFLEAISGVLLKSVQNDLAVMNLTKRLAMFKLSEGIQRTAEKAEPAQDKADEPAKAE